MNKNRPEKREEKGGATEYINVIEGYITVIFNSKIAKYTFAPLNFDTH